VEFKPFQIANTKKGKFTGLIQGLSKKQVQEIRSLRGHNLDMTLEVHTPLVVFFDQFRFKKYLRDDVPPLSTSRISMILVLLLFWFCFLIFLIATALAYYLDQPSWMVESFCMVGAFLLFLAGATTFWDRSRKSSVKKRSDSSVDPFDSLNFLNFSDGEAVVILLIILMAIVLSMFLFVFIWLPILFVILNIITLRNIEDRYRTVEITIRNPQGKSIDRLATKIILSGGYLSQNWEPWIENSRIRRTAKISRERNHKFINTTMIFAVFSFLFMFFLVVSRIYINIFMWFMVFISGIIALVLFILLLHYVFQGRSTRKGLYEHLFTIDSLK
jgi:hypothetical protein